VSFEAVKTDTGAFLDFLGGLKDVKGSKVGVTGYCMGGRVALIAAAEFPDRIAAAGAFHPGHLTTDKPDSPHLLAPKIRARVYVGGADEDAGFTPEHRDQLSAALTSAGVDNRVEIYEGARHGYTMPDLSVYNEAGAERHWRELLALFDSTLK
jgi:carboxymethylenebutenolidase